MPPQFQPDQALFVSQAIFIPALQSEHRVTRSVLDAVVAGNPDYRPDPHSRTAYELASHIAVAENRFLDFVATGEFNTSYGKPDSIRGASELSSWYGAEFERNLQRVSKLSGEQLAKELNFRGIFQRPAINFLQLSLHHTVHHRGQLSAYLRAMGAKVPAIYGESYDSAEAHKSAQA